MDETVDECMIDPFKEVVSRAEMPMTEHIKYLGASAMGTLRSRLYYFESAIRTETNEIDFRECQNICSLMKWDYAELEEAAAAAHPYPKQWARLEKNTPSPLTSAEEYALEVQAEAAISEAEQPAIEQEKGQHSYTDEKGRILSVSSGISQGNTFITVRRVPGKTGSHRVVSSKLPARKKRELAQKDLDAYAVAKSYKIYELSVPQ
jgi:hypothetical protein